MGAGEKEGRDESLFPSVTGRCIGNTDPGRDRVRGSVFGSRRDDEREKDEKTRNKRANLQETSLIKR